MQHIDRTEGDINQASWRNEWRAALPESSRLLLDEDDRLFLHQSLSTPCLDVLDSASGALIRSVSGAEWLDFHGNNVHQAGHAHPRILAAVREQLERLPFCPRRFTNRPAIDLARELLRRAPPSLGKVLFAPGGAEAVSMALKLARLATRKPGVLAFWDSFHGATLDAISAGGEHLFRDPMEPLLPGFHHLPPPIVPPSHRGSAALEAQRDPDAIDFLLRREPTIGALIAEPFRYGFALRPPAGYWKRVRDICDRRGVLLIFDEIPVCLGRAGHWFACEPEGVEPDMLVLGKGLGGGVYPMAALLARPALDVGADTALGHFTHEKSPVGAAAGLALIDLIESENLLQKVRDDSAFFAEALQPLGNVFAQGLQVAVEVADDATADRILHHSLQNGLSFKISGGNLLSLAPPLTIPRAQLAQAIDILQGSNHAAGSAAERNESSRRGPPSYSATTHAAGSAAERNESSRRGPPSYSAIQNPKSAIP